MKRHQGSLQKWVILGIGHGKDKTRHLVSENKEMLEGCWGHVKRKQKQA